MARPKRRKAMSKGGALVLGAVSLVLSAGSITVGLLTRVSHPRRFIAFLVLCSIFLVVAVVLFISSARSKSAAT